MPIFSEDNTPWPIQDFARREPSFMLWAANDPTPHSGPLHFDESLAKLLDDVNREGNTKITWSSDMATWGVEENWDFPCVVRQKLFDDCDGFTLWKMRRLMQLGVGATALLPTFVNDELGEGHMVLVVVTDGGDFVLDNRQTTVMTVHQLQSLGYNFLRRPASGQHLDGRWVQMSPTSAIPTFHPGPMEVAPKTPLCQERAFLK